MAQSSSARGRLSLVDRIVCCVTLDPTAHAEIVALRAAAAALGNYRLLAARCM